MCTISISDGSRRASMIRSELVGNRSASWSPGRTTAPIVFLRTAMMMAVRGGTDDHPRQDVAGTLQPALQFPDKRGYLVELCQRVFDPLRLLADQLLFCLRNCRTGLLYLSRHRADLTDKLRLRAQQRSVFGPIGQSLVEQQLLAFGFVIDDGKLRLQRRQLALVILRSPSGRNRPASSGSPSPS